MLTAPEYLARLNSPTNGLSAQFSISEIHLARFAMSRSLWAQGQCRIDDPLRLRVRRDADRQAVSFHPARSIKSARNLRGTCLPGG